MPMIRLMSDAIDGDRSFVKTRDYRGHEVLAAYMPLGYRDWGIVAKIDAPEAYVAVDHLASLILNDRRLDAVGRTGRRVVVCATGHAANRATDPIGQPGGDG